MDYKTDDASIRRKEVYASFTDASCIFLNLGTIIYPIPIISSVRKLPSVTSYEVGMCHGVIMINDPMNMRITAVIMNGLLTEL